VSAASTSRNPVVNRSFVAGRFKKSSGARPRLSATRPPTPRLVVLYAVTGRRTALNGGGSASTEGVYGTAERRDGGVARASSNSSVHMFSPQSLLIYGPKQTTLARTHTRNHYRGRSSIYKNNGHMSSLEVNKRLLLPPRNSLQPIMPAFAPPHYAEYLTYCVIVVRITVLCTSANSRVQRVGNSPSEIPLTWLDLLNAKNVLILFLTVVLK